MGAKPIVKKLPDVPAVPAEEGKLIQVPVPDTDSVNPQMLIKTKRDAPLRKTRVEHLKETHGMTTESDRFKSS